MPISGFEDRAPGGDEPDNVAGQAFVEIGSVGEQRVASIYFPM